MNLRNIVLLSSVWLVASSTCLRGQEISYQRDIRPILAANCFACHGPDEEARQADLRLDTFAGATDDERGDPAVVPNEPESSSLVDRIRSQDEDLLMPPPDTGLELSGEQKSILETWIRAGGTYEDHWAFVPPKKPATPNVSQVDWAHNDIDKFLMSHWDRIGLSPAKPAGRHQLIRRLSLDLTGLPPTLDQVQRFVDDSEPDAYERLVDTLLDSEQYGEHWARLWLDLARYADSKGYEKDQPREMWRYRDWVIDAINKDLPFDQFTIEQLAGDLLSDPSVDQRLATAFHRNTMTNDEGGTDNEEFRMIAVKDRVDTTMQVWMGLTMGCAKCHSHKYDPITQQDYYRFLDFFNQTQDADRNDDFPKLATPTLQQAQELDRLTLEIKQLKQSYLEESPELVEARERWIEDLAQQQVWSPLVPLEATSESETTFEILSDRSILAKGPASEKEVYIVEFDLPATPFNALRIEALTDPSMKRGGPGRNGSDPNFVLSELTMEIIGDERKPIEILSAKADFSQKGWPVNNAFDGTPETGWAISPKQGEPHVAVFHLNADSLGTGGRRLRMKLSQQYGNRLVLGRIRFSLARGEHDDPALEPRVGSLPEIARLMSSDRTAQQTEQLNEAFRQHWPSTAEISASIKTLDAQRAALNQQIPKTPVMQDLADDKRRNTHVHLRGNFLQPGDLVSAGIPEALGELGADSPKNRLGVAQWLVGERNPLTSRVAVNRIWARLFGRGIVETEEDFGAQGALPSHPRLLDWLAVSFQHEWGWSQKQLLKTIVMSSAYRMSNVASEESQELDPQNRWLSYAPRFRLPGETVRDQALAASGLLSSKIGGPSVMPPQPPGIWQTTYSSLKWQTSEGEDRYRRGLYTFWRRTSPYPSLLTFDAGSREVCVIRRVRTNTPLQALVTLNDPVYVEAAGALAERMHEHPGSLREQLRFGFQLVLIRPPSQSEVDRLEELVESVARDLETSELSTQELLDSANLDSASGPKVAALVVAGNVLLNLDEALMRN